MNKVDWNKPTLQENIDYFKNRVAFEIPVHDTPQFKAILKALREAQARAECSGFDSYEYAKKHHFDD